MIINCDKNLLTRYCRIGVPIKIIKIFDIAGNKFESKNINIICDNNKIINKERKVLIKSK